MVFVVMNYEIHPYIFFNFLALSDIIIACDGGSNRFYKLFQNHNK